MGHWPPIVVSRFLGGISASGHSPSSAVTLAPGLVANRSGHGAWYLVVTWHSLRVCESSFDWKSIPLRFRVLPFATFFGIFHSVDQ